MTTLHTMNQRRRRAVMGPYAPRKPIHGVYGRWAADRHRNVEQAKRRRQEPEDCYCGGGRDFGHAQGCPEGTVYRRSPAHDDLEEWQIGGAS